MFLKKFRKFLLLILISLILLFSSCSLNLDFDLDSGEVINDKYYQTLEDRCINNFEENKNCCISSVKIMKLTNSTLAEKNFLDEEHCDTGFKKENLKCPTSYSWCSKI